MRRAMLVLWSAVFVAMSAVTTWASLDRDVLTAAAQIWADPWGRATLFDAYFAFLAVYLWIFYREPGWTARIGWAIALACLGNFAIAAYVIRAVWSLPSDAPPEALLLRAGKRTEYEKRT